MALSGKRSVTEELFSRKLHRDLQARVGPGARDAVPLLLLLSRETLSEEEQERARDLARGIRDWPGLVKAAERMRGLSFVEKHVREIGLLPPDQAGLARQMSGKLERFSFQWLKVAREQARFAERCLDPLGVPHVFLKGLTLANYYDNPGLRFSRDIDVLIEPEALGAVLARAEAQGYRMMLTPRDGLFVEADSDRDAVLLLKDDIPLMSPDGILVEVHRSLHEDLPHTLVNTMIAEARDARIANRACKVLPTGLLMPYLCAHHIRHTWDTSNYVADIAAIRRHADWDEAAVRDWARRVKLEHVVEAALDFEAATRSGDLSGDDMAGCFGTLYALHVTGTKAADRGLDRALKVVRRWMHRMDKPLVEYWTVFRRQFRPTMQDYVALRVPVRRLFFYWLLGGPKIIGKSRRWLMGDR